MSDNTNKLITLGGLNTYHDEMYKLVNNAFNVTWNELKNKRDAGELVPGQQYRITDYVTTTTLVNTISVGKPFDIIVTADSESVLNENARATASESYTSIYSDGGNPDAWEIKYCLDNDTDRFDWVDDSDSGRGVIYYMKDEWNNECPYDFKNIQFKNLNDSADTNYYYTFGKTWDASFTGSCYNNIISATFNSGKLILNNCYGNLFGENCCNNFIDENANRNRFGNNCSFNTLGPGCSNNLFGDDCFYNKLTSLIIGNVFGNNCSFNTLDGPSTGNVFGNGCNYNKVGSLCFTNIFNDTCLHNVLCNGVSGNLFGVGCNSNVIRVGATNNSLKEYTCNCKINDNCKYIDLTSDMTVAANYNIKNVTINNNIQGTSDAHVVVTINTLNADNNIEVNEETDELGSHILLSKPYTQYQMYNLCLNMLNDYDYTGANNVSVGNFDAI